MKQRDLPLWLAGDVIAFVGVLGSFFSLLTHFVPAVVRMLKEKRRGLAPAEFGEIARLLAEAEAQVRIAITRRALWLCGLSPSRAKLIERAPPANEKALARRLRAYMQMLGAMTSIANSQAQRLKRFLPAEPSVRFAAGPFPAFHAGQDFAHYPHTAQRGEVLHRRSRGRWIGAPSRRDGLPRRSVAKAGRGRPHLAGGWRRNSSSSSTNTREGHRVRAPPWPRPATQQIPASQRQLPRPHPYAHVPAEAPAKPLHPAIGRNPGFGL